MKKALLKSFQLLVILSLFFAVGCEKEKDVSVTDVTLNENKITLALDETATLIATVCPDDADNKTVSWTSSDETVAEVADGLVTAKKVGTATITVTTIEGNYAAKCEVTVIPKEVGILINGIRWATRNVDAPGTFTANPEDAGMFYQWNRKVGWSTTDPIINSNGGTTWDSSIPEGDSLEKANDPCPSGWRVPTFEEQLSLVISDSEWTTLNGVMGCYFGSGEQTVFFPAAGDRYYIDGTIYGVGSVGFYWNATPGQGNRAYAGSLYFSSQDVYPNFYSRRSGFSVRCVSEE